MSNPFLGVRIPPELDTAIAARVRETGQSKSDLVIAALRAYLGLPSEREQLAAIERRLAALEAIVGETLGDRSTFPSAASHSSSSSDAHSST